jgi:sporulation-control protein spo0M
MSIAFGALFQIVMAFSIAETWKSFKFAPLLAGYVFYTEPRKQKYKKGEEITLHLKLQSGKNEINPFSLKLLTEYVPDKTEETIKDIKTFRTEREIPVEDSIQPLSEKDFEFRINAGEGIDTEGQIFVKTSVNILLTGKSGRKTNIITGNFSYLLEKQEA